MPNNNNRRNLNGARNNRNGARNNRNGARNNRNGARNNMNGAVRQAPRRNNSRNGVMVRLTLVDSNGRRHNVNVPVNIANRNYVYNWSLGAHRRRNQPRRAPMVNRSGGMWN